MTDQFSPFGMDLFGEPISKARGPIASKFTLPPFSVLDSQSGDWQERKSAWLSLGLQSETGRKAVSQSSIQAVAYKNGGRIPQPNDRLLSGSIFDPVLCELIYKWFAPEYGQIVDPFAGGSVRGVVASLLGYHYWGCDLRAEQIVANEAQADLICNGTRPVWRCGDAIEVLADAPSADMIFTCPPYGDLERYSEDPRDLSTMDYHTFVAALKRIILRCAQLLKAGRYACMVVGDFRDKRTGNYRGFVADTIHAFQECGLPLYNDAVLVTSVGNLPIRISKQFEAGRKLGKMHQNVLVFRKPLR